MSALDALARPVGPLPLGVWLLAGAGGLYLQQQRGGREPQLVTDVREVPVPVGAIASPDQAHDVSVTPIIYVTTPLPNTPTPTPAPKVVVPLPVPIPRPVVKPGVPTVLQPPVRVLPGGGAPSPTTRPPLPILKPVPKPGVRTYVVRSGDTLSKIAASHHTTAPVLYRKNARVIEAAARAHGKVSSSAGRFIYAGTKLVLP